MMNTYQENSVDPFGDDRGFLALRDKTTRAFRQDQRDGERKIIENMVRLRHNMQYNEHLRSVYEKAKSIFDTMVDEQRVQIQSLDNIYRHLYQVIREERTHRHRNNKVIEMKKDMEHIGRLLKRMRQNLEYLMNVDTVVGITIDKLGKIKSLDDVVDIDGDGDGDGDGDWDGDGDDSMSIINYVEPETYNDDDESSDDESSDDESGDDESGDDESSDDESGEGESGDDEHFSNNHIPVVSNRKTNVTTANIYDSIPTYGTDAERYVTK
jgi:hypothetical protein